MCIIKFKKNISLATPCCKTIISLSLNLAKMYVNIPIRGEGGGKKMQKAEIIINDHKIIIAKKGL